jgi:hypothetical protein
MDKNILYNNICLFDHNNSSLKDKRNCIYDEALACIKLNKDKKDIIDKQIKFYQKINYPKNNGLVATGFMIRNHTNDKIILLMEKWWEMIKNYSYRDQLSFNYVAWKYKMQYYCLDELFGGSIRKNNFFDIQKHLK